MGQTSAPHGEEPGRDIRRASLLESPATSKVYEPELDMNRHDEAPATDVWSRLVAALRSFALARAIVGRPKRSVDRERQEFPFGGD